MRYYWYVIYVCLVCSICVSHKTGWKVQKVWWGLSGALGVHRKLSGQMDIHPPKKVYSIDTHPIPSPCFFPPLFQLSSARYQCWPSCSCAAFASFCVSTTWTSAFFCSCWRRSLACDGWQCHGQLGWDKCGHSSPATGILINLISCTWIMNPQTN